MQSAITHLFAGVPVSDLDVSIDWYTRFFGRTPRQSRRVPEQPVPRDVVAAMASAGDGEAAHWRVDFWIADADAAAARATELGGSVVAGPDDAPPFREAVLRRPGGRDLLGEPADRGPLAAVTPRRRQDAPRAR